MFMMSHRRQTVAKLLLLLSESLRIGISQPEASRSEAEDAGTQIIKRIRLHPAVPGADSVHEEVDERRDERRV